METGDRTLEFESPITIKYLIFYISTVNINKGKYRKNYLAAKDKLRQNIS